MRLHTICVPNMVIQSDLIRDVLPLLVADHAQKEGALVALVDLDVDVFGGGVEGHVVYRVAGTKMFFFFFFLLLFEWD